MLDKLRMVIDIVQIVLNIALIVVLLKHIKENKEEE